MTSNHTSVSAVSTDSGSSKSIHGFNAKTFSSLQQ